jgi:kumamolisin
MIQKGTSAVSPLFAALTARLMSIYGINKVQQDFQNGGYYRIMSYRDITTGNNGAYSAGVGWDAQTGMGSFAKYLTQTTSTITTPTSTSTTTTTTTSNSVSLGNIILIIYNLRSF